MKRIKALREEAFNTSHITEKFYYLFYKKYNQLSELDEYSRYAEAYYYAFDNFEPVISEHELIVGRYNTVFSDTEGEEWNNTYRAIADARREKAGGGQDSHMSIDYELLLSKGIIGVIALIDEHLKTANAEKRKFYECSKICLKAVVNHAEHYAQKALEESEKAETSERREELLKIAEICKKVPLKPAESFYEALQSVHFITYCLSLNPFRLYHQQFQLGHPDRYLLSYYENDIKNGKITRNEAQILLDCLAIQINLRVPSGLSSGYMVGGRDEHGNIVANELTDMCMQVIDDVRLVYPAVGLCYTEGMPEEYLDKAIALISKGYSHPAIFNDDIIVKGLLSYGIPKTQAYNYIHSTCVEITPVASSNVWVASPYTNMPQLLLDIMDKEYSDFDALLKTYFDLLDSRIKSNYEEQNYLRTVREENSINPLLSCFVNDCLKRGKDIEQGGAVYNWILPSFVGMANLVDALYAIRKLVFEDKKLTICDFKSILDCNFEGNELLRLQILNKISKYGNDDDDIDSFFVLISEHIAAECQKYQGKHTNGNLMPSVFCWIMHERFGRETSATPDGRVAGFPLGDGSGPCQGREINGPTASVLSSTKWDHSKFIGGVAVNLKFSKSSLGAESLTTMKSIVKTYLERGGFEVQINVIDNEILKKAQINPLEYRDLVVRIGGYSDYFVRLSKEMQEEVILRTAHNA